MSCCRRSGSSISVRPAFAGCMVTIGRVISTRAGLPPMLPPPPQWPSVAIDSLIPGTYRCSRGPTYFNSLLRTRSPNNDSPNTFFFLDPPYEGKDHYGSGYGGREHRVLASMIDELRGTCLMVVDDSPLMRELHRGRIVGRYG